MDVPLVYQDVYKRQLLEDKPFNLEKAQAVLEEIRQNN